MTGRMMQIWMILLTRRISLITMLNFLMRILFIVNRDTESKDMVRPAIMLGIILY
jgi:hypothetical protein